MKSNRLSKEGYAPIYLRYSYKGAPAEYFTGKSILPDNWDDDDKQPIFLSKAIAKKVNPNIKYTSFCSTNEVVEILSLMNELELEIKDIESKLEVFTSKDIIKGLRHDPTQVQSNDKPMLVGFINDHLENHKGKTKNSTLDVYTTVKNMIADYELSINRSFKISEIDYGYMKGVAEYMNSLGLFNSTINRRIKHIRGFISKARKMGYDVNPSYQDFGWSAEETEVMALTMDELKKIESLDLSGNRLYDLVRDVFLFACYTGLRYSDFSKLNKTNIKDGFLRMTITKTKNLQTVPLTKKKAKCLIKKYHSNNSDFVFPMCGARKFNDVIKKICELAKIDEVIEKVRFSGVKEVVEYRPKYQMITAHVARKTFVTLSLELGMQAEEVMRITGHKDYKSFKRYVNITEKRAKVALLSAWEK